MPGLNKVYLPRPRPLVLHVCASHPGLEYGLVQGKLDVSRPLYSLAQEPLPSLKMATSSLQGPGRHHKWEAWGGRWCQRQCKGNHPL